MRWRGYESVKPERWFSNFRNIGLTLRGGLVRAPGQRPPPPPPPFQPVWSAPSPVFASLTGLQVRGAEPAQGPRSQNASRRVVPDFCVHLRAEAGDKALRGKSVRGGAGRVGGAGSGSRQSRAALLLLRSPAGNGGDEKDGGLGVPASLCALAASR